MNGFPENIVDTASSVPRRTTLLRTSDKQSTNGRDLLPVAAADRIYANGCCQTWHSTRGARRSVPRAALIYICEVNVRSVGVCSRNTGIPLEALRSLVMQGSIEGRNSSGSLLGNQAGDLIGHRPG